MNAVFNLRIVISKSYSPTTTRIRQHWSSFKLYVIIIK